MITQRTKNNIAKFAADYNKTVAEVYGQESKDNALAEDCTLIIKTDYEESEKEIKNFFMHCLITNLV